MLKGLPRLQTEAQAAATIGIEVATFRHLVACGRLPKAIPALDLYDLKAIDAALDRLSGIGTPGNALDRWREQRNAG
jgi:hypothetical protein